MTSSSTRIPRCEVVGLRETIYAAGPLPVFGARVLGLFLCVRLTLPAPGAARRGLQYLAGHRLPHHRRLHAPDRGSRQRPGAGCGGAGSGLADRRRRPVGVLVLKVRPELYSSRHKTAGLNVQVACTLSGCLAGVSDPRMEGATIPRPCTAADCSRSPPPTYPTGHHHPGILASKDTSDWAWSPRRESPRICHSAPTTEPTTPPLTRSATRSSESLQKSRPEESCAPAKEDL